MFPVTLLSVNSFVFSSISCTIISAALHDSGKAALPMFYMMIIKLILCAPTICRLGALPLYISLSGSLVNYVIGGKDKIIEIQMG